QGGKRKDIMPPKGLTDSPRRIDQDQIARPKQFDNVKPKEPAGDERAVEQRKSKRLSMFDGEFSLRPDCHQAGDKSDYEKRKERRKVSFPAQNSALPPKNDQQHSR